MFYICSTGLRTVKVRVSTAIVKATWRLGSRAPLVTVWSPAIKSYFIHNIFTGRSTCREQQWKEDTCVTFKASRVAFDLRSCPKVHMEIPHVARPHIEVCTLFHKTYARTVKQTVSSEAENGEWDWGETLAKWDYYATLNRSWEKKTPTVLQSNISVSKHKAVETVIDRKVDLRI